MKNLFNRILYYIQSLPVLLLKTNFWVIPKLLLKQECELKLYDNSVFYVRNLLDIWIIKETYLNQDYLHNGFEIPKTGVIIDIGAFIGDYSIWVSRQNPKTTIYAIEPSRENFGLLQRNISINKIKNIKYFNTAIHSSKHTVTLVTKDINLGQSYITEENNSDYEKTNAVSLQKFFEQNNILVCEILKLDCEGAEYDILLNCDKAFLQRYVRKIILEYHTIEGEDLKNLGIRLTKYLQSTGYSVTILPPKFNNGTGFMRAEYQNLQKK